MSRLYDLDYATLFTGSRTEPREYRHRPLPRNGVPDGDGPSPATRPRNAVTPQLVRAVTHALHHYGARIIPADIDIRDYDTALTILRDNTDDGQYYVRPVPSPSIVVPSFRHIDDYAGDNAPYVPSIYAIAIDNTERAINDIAAFLRS